MATATTHGTTDGCVGRDIYALTTTANGATGGEVIERGAIFDRATRPQGVGIAILE